MNFEQLYEQVIEEKKFKLNLSKIKIPFLKRLTQKISKLIKMRLEESMELSEKKFSDKDFVDVINRYKITSDDKEKEKIIDDVISSNMDLVYSRAKHRNFGGNRVISFEDLVQTGVIAIIAAMNNYDVSKTSKPSVYFYRYIDNFIKNVIKHNGKLPTVSLDAPIDNDNGDEFINYTASLDDFSNIISNKEDIEYMMKIIKNLPKLERDIIEMYFGINKYDKKHTYDQIAKKYNYTKQRIGQLINKEILPKIKKRLI